MKQNISFIICLLYFYPLIAQKTIKGRVVNESGSGLYGCNVFINNTHIGSVSDANGYFELNSVPKGQHELIISSIGYETNIFPFFEEQLPLQLKVELVIKAEELENVTVSSEHYVTGNWSQYGDLFTKSFIGQMDFASRCKIRNKDALTFRFYEKSQRLTVAAKEPMIMENHALGYVINYQLEKFEVNLEKGHTSFRGYALFTEMEPNNKAEEKKWKRNREQAYQGSVMQFMRSLYHNSIAEDGFEVSWLAKKPNVEKQRIQSIYKDGLSYKKLSNGVTVLETVKGHPGLSRDTLDYYNRILHQPDSLNLPGPPLKGMDIITATTNGYSILKFNGQLRIYYKNIPPDRFGLPAVSFISLAPGSSVNVDENGYFYDSQDVFASGYWGFSERAGNFLPQDYESGYEREKPDRSFVDKKESKVDPIQSKPPISAKITLNAKSIVRDSSGMEYPVYLWQPMLASGNYTVVAIDSTNPATTFLLYAVTDKKTEEYLLKGMKPRESTFFRTGAGFSPLYTTDIDGKQIDTKGKLLVLNYWFINCPPCRLEIPKLNDLVYQYKENPDIIFVAIALDPRGALVSDRVTNPFKYHIVSDGRRFADQYRINAYPTHVIINKEGKIVFHCTGYNNSIGYWLEKAIEENK